MVSDIHYTVLDGEGYVIKRHCTLAEAADLILTSDGRDWAIFADAVDDLPDGSTLYQHTLHACYHASGGPWVEADIAARSIDRETAVQDIYRQVIERSHYWRGHAAAIPDEQYDREQAKHKQNEGRNG